MVTTNNYILRALPEGDLEMFVEHSYLVDLQLREVVAEPNEPIKFVDFVESGIHSMVACAAGEQVEVATVGREGMVGIATLLGSSTTICRCFCQVPGSSRRIAVADLRSMLTSSSIFRARCERFSFSLFEQTAQNSACNRLHSINERCAKWLLLTHDKLQEKRFELTQDFLAQMLGVRRQSVNLAAGTLQAAGLIRYSRGVVEILKRDELEEVACECFPLIRNSLLTLME